MMPSHRPTDSPKANVWATLVFCAVVLDFVGCQPAPDPIIQPEPVNGAAGIGDPYYAQLGNGGYDVQKYTISLDVDPAMNSVSGTVTIEAKATERLSSLNLDFQGLTVDSVTINDSSATFTRQEPELMIMPRQPLAIGSSFSISIHYHGNPQPIENIASRDSSGTAGWYRSADGSINVLSEPNGAAGWFPVNDHPRDKATYRFEVTVPKPWVVAATGTLRETIEEGDRTRYIWEMDKPMASYLASINVGLYAVETTHGPGGG